MVSRLVAACFLLCTQTLFAQTSSTQSLAPGRPPDQLRVLSYNIHHGAGTDNKIDLGRIARVIQSVDPDLVMLQEVDRNVRRSGNVDQANQLAKLTNLQAVFGPNIDLQGGQYGNALLTRLPLIESRNERLPNVDSGEQRGAIHATVWFFGMPLRVVSTHFDHRRDDRERVASAIAINQRLSETPDVPAILAGDINATRDSSTLNTLIKRWSIAGPDSPTIPVVKPTRQIDFIMFRPTARWTVMETRVLEESVASDHRAIFSVLKWTESDAEHSKRVASRRNVLRVPDSTGDSDASTTDQWRAREQSIRYGVESIMGRLPSERKPQPPAYQVLSEVDCGSYIRQQISYQSETDCQTPAYLCIPKSLPDDGSVRVPAVLCLHPTDNRVGYDVVVGLSDRPNRQYAAELAERGFVTLSPSYPLLASYQPDIRELGWKSGTLKAVWDNMRGVDLLQSLPYVRDEAIAAIGHSLGGHNAIFTAVHDSRIQAVFSSCGLDSFRDYYGGDEQKWFPEKGWTQTRYMPRLSNYRGRLDDIPFDFHELIALLAPRHVMIAAPVGDANFRRDSVQDLTREARRVFALHGHPGRLIVHHPDCEHDFPVEMRMAAYDLFESVFDFKGEH